jgi:hypothetical protein
MERLDSAVARPFFGHDRRRASIVDCGGWTPLWISNAQAYLEDLSSLEK